MRTAIAGSLEALVRCFLWLWIAHHVRGPQIPCDDYPFGYTHRFEPSYEFLATVVIAAVVSAPVFAATVLILRKALADAAIRAFAAGCVCEAGRLALVLYLDRDRTDLCANPVWSLWGWPASAFIAGSASVLAHWLIVRAASIVDGLPLALTQAPKRMPIGPREDRAMQQTSSFWRAALSRAMSPAFPANARILYLEAVARTFLLSLIGHLVRGGRWASCADYPEAKGPEPFAIDLSMIGVMLVFAAFSAPVFVAAIVPLRLLGFDPAIRAFIAGCLVLLPLFLLSDYVETRGDPCSNPTWSAWAWLPALSVGGAAALLAHWLIHRGLGRLLDRSSRADLTGFRSDISPP